jgi:hypothetical protein
MTIRRTEVNDAYELMSCYVWILICIVWRFIGGCNVRKRVDAFSSGGCSFLFSIGVVDRLKVEQRSLGSFLVF